MLICRPKRPLTEKQKNCIRVRWCPEMPLEGRRTCAMIKCGVQLRNEVGCPVTETVVPANFVMMGGGKNKKCGEKYYYS